MNRIFKESPRQSIGDKCFGSRRAIPVAGSREVHSLQLDGRH